MGKRDIFNKINDFFDLVLKDPQRKSIASIFSDYAIYSLSNQRIAEQYFSKYLYRRGNQNHDDYLVTHEVQEKCWNLNSSDYVSILSNKYLFELFFSSHNLPVAKSIARNINTLFFLPDRLVQITNSSGFAELLESFFINHQDHRSIFIKKTAASAGGKNIYKITPEDLRTGRQKLDNIFNKIIESGYLFQYEIIQHDDINRLNPHCLNTLRMDTFTDKNNQTFIMSGYFRVGLNKSHVDNVSSGGAYLGVDITNGVLYSEAFSDFTNGKGVTYRIHPENNMVFDGYRIPFYNEIMDLVLRAAQKVPRLKVIGWDVAIQPGGPVLIEGNEQPSLVFSEVGCKGYGDNPVFMKMYNELKER